MLTGEERKIVDMIVAAYVTVMGLEKWNSLTGREQHDAIMLIASSENIWRWLLLAISKKYGLDSVKNSSQYPLARILSKQEGKIKHEWRISY